MNRSSAKGEVSHSVTSPFTRMIVACFGLGFSGSFFFPKSPPIFALADSTAPSAAASVMSLAPAAIAQEPATP